MLGIISYHTLVRFWLVLATPTHCLGVTELALRVSSVNQVGSLPLVANSGEGVIWLWLVFMGDATL